MKSVPMIGLTYQDLRLSALFTQRLLMLIAFSSLVLLAARSGFGSEPAVVIKMLDMPPSFQPSMVTIKAGDTVEWENVGSSVHHATNDHDIAIKRDDVSNPDGELVFDSGFLQPGGTFMHTFTKPGIYKYVCVVHEPSGMIGEVVVK